MNITTWFKVGTFTLTVVVSSLLVWLDFPAHQGTLAGLMVFLSGLMVVFCYELYMRLYTDIGRKFWAQKNMITSELKLMDLLRQQQSEILQQTGAGLVAVEKAVNRLHLEQKEVLRRVGGVSTGVVSMVELLTQVVGHLERFFQRERESKEKVIELIEKSSRSEKESKDKVIELIEKSSQAEKESKVKLLEAIVQLQKGFEFAAKRDLETKEKLVEIVTGSH